MEGHKKNLIWIQQLFPADFVSGRIWALEYDGIQPATNLLLADTDLNISSFGLDDNNELYFCAFDCKIYRFQPTVNPIKPQQMNLIDSYSLFQNFPNPFNSSTSIGFFISENFLVNLSIFDISGHLVKELVNENLYAGFHVFNWDGKDQKRRIQSSGFYVYQLRLNEKVREVRKMLILK
jgi:hypothetical protein